MYECLYIYCIIHKFKLTTMSKSKNWVADAIPSFDGSKTTLEVSAIVNSGLIAPKLVLNSTKEKLPPNVIALELQNEVPDGATEVIVEFKTDITNKKSLEIVIVFNEVHEIIAAIRINRNIVS